MIIDIFVSALWNGSRPSASGQWMAWPFTDYGWTAGFWPIVTKILFMGVLFGAIALVLRLLFGPKGPLRGAGWETMQEARKREGREQDGEACSPGAEQDETRKNSNGQ